VPIASFRPLAGHFRSTPMNSVAARLVYQAIVAHGGTLQADDLT
jgi:hypothetical protein